MAIKILVVDDDVNVLTTVADILVKKGYKVIKAANGERALEKVHKQRPNIVLLDTRLPDINGNEVCRQIKELGGPTIKVIVYTGDIDAVDAGRARVAGADDYVVKTSDFSLLLEAIKKAV